MALQLKTDLFDATDRYFGGMPSDEQAQSAQIVHAAGIPLEDYLPGWRYNDAYQPDGRGSRAMRDENLYVPDTEIPAHVAYTGPPVYSDTIALKTRDANPSVPDGYVGYHTSPTYKSADGNPYVPEENNPINNALLNENPSGINDNYGILTDKKSVGVYEQKPFIMPSLVNSVKTDYGALLQKINTPLLTDPGAQGLQTVQTSNSPIQANLSGSSAYLSGTDPAQEITAQAAQPVSSSDTIQQDTSPARPSDCGTFDFACKWGTVSQEVYLFIIGVVVLAIGIWAITRGN